MVDMLGRWLAPREVSPTRGETIAAAPVPTASGVPEATFDMVAIGKIRAIAAKRGTALLDSIVSQFAEIFAASRGDDAREDRRRRSKACGTRRTI